MRDLLDPSKRQAAWKQLVEREPMTSFQDDEDRQSFLDAAVTHVVECPQAQGEPMLAVFLDGEEGKADGWFALVEPDGARLITCPCDGDNVLDPSSSIIDINNDGILERVSVSCVGDERRRIDELTVTPITPDLKPILTILFNRRCENDSLLSLIFRDNAEEVLTALQGTTGRTSPIRPKRIKKTHWFWRVAGKPPLDCKLEMGPIIKQRFEVEATFYWPPTSDIFVGPKGGPDDVFAAFPGQVPDADFDAFCGRD